jgi:hypothetical protein
MPMSGVLLDFASDHIDAELRLPVDRLEIAFGESVSVPAAGGTFAQEAKMRSYLVSHIQPRSTDGRPWQVELGGIEFIADTPMVLVARARLIPPVGAPVRKLEFNYDVIAHEILTHSVVVAVRKDWPGGKTSAEPETLGVIRYQQKSVAIDRGPGGWTHGTSALFRLGARHILEGTDHLLFLLTLLLPAPLLASAGRWRDRASLRTCATRIAAIVTSFSLGHSLTLLAGTQGWLRLPEQPVEIAIAVSLLVSAAHALRPVFPGREMWIAGGFGLVHGFAFAAALAELNFRGGQLAWSLAAFNLGIEAMQLLVVAMTLPWLVLLSRAPFYRHLRVAGAALAGVAALGWISERVLATSNPVTRGMELLASHSLALLGAVAALALGHFAWSCRQSASARTSLFQP